MKFGFEKNEFYISSRFIKDCFLLEITLLICLQVLNILGKKFGYEVNSKGKKVLPKYLRVLQGDGISYETLKSVLQGIDKAGWSTENMVFGSGGALLQKVDRDTQKCAFKCSFAVVDGKPVSA